MKYWVIASYKINEIKRLEVNLLNQKFAYYLPKITKKKVNSPPKEEVLFPGYIFININIKNYSALKNTKGIKKILKFGNNISYIPDEEIKTFKFLEKSSKKDPMISKIKIGQEAIISKGSFRGTIVQIISLPSKNRVNVLLSILGSFRRVNISEYDLIY